MEYLFQSCILINSVNENVMVTYNIGLKFIALYIQIYNYIDIEEMFSWFCLKELIFMSMFWLSSK